MAESSISDGSGSNLHNETEKRLSPWLIPVLKSKLHDRLHQAQDSLLKQSEERHALHSSEEQVGHKQPEHTLDADSGRRRQQTRKKTVTVFQASTQAALASECKQPGLEEPLLDKAPKASPSDSLLQAPKRAATSAGRFAMASAPLLGKKHIGSPAASTSARSSASAKGQPNRISRANTFDDAELASVRAKPIFKEVKSRVFKGMAYMGVDWYTIQQRKQKLSWLFVAEELYYWCYAIYIVIIILVGTLLLWALEPDGKFSLMQALYTSASCVSQSGLAVVDWSAQASSTYIVSFFLILLGSASLLHMVPVLLRLHSFRMQSRLCQLRRGTLSATPQAATQKTLFPRCHSDPGKIVRSQSSASEITVDASQASPAHALGLDEDGALKPSQDLDESHRMEYFALKKVLQIVIGYWLMAHVIGFLVFFSYFRFGHGKIQDKFFEEGLSPHWHALYLSVSSFQNNGLVLTPSSVMDFAHSPILLCTIGSLVLLGNTCLPIMVRLIAVFLERRSQPGSDDKMALDFLLEHPRRCFTHMFPAVHTLWLLVVVVALNVFGVAVILFQDSHQGLAFHGQSRSDVFFNALFQTVSARTAGLNSIDIAKLSQGTTFFLAVMMYFSTTPTVVTMRLSVSRHELDITGRIEGVEDEILTGRASLKNQARRYLTQDATYLTVILFLICCWEQQSFVAASRVSHHSDGIYNDFGFFKVLFELVSAYGTCGLSLGYKNQTFSFSGVWCESSQLLLVVTMVLGRLRGLPDAIDASVRAAMPRQISEAEEEHNFVHL